VQFEKPLIEFQALRHRLAECAAGIEVARALTYHALSLYDRGEECVKEVAMAKLVATETACRVTDEALQIHGGYGYMMEYPIQRLWRDARLGRVGGGTSEIMAEVIADRLGLPRERAIRP
jgi:acyl-CoA dehydrogenase